MDATSVVMGKFGQRRKKGSKKKMKITTVLLFVIILPVILLSACRSKKEDNTIKFITGNYYNKNWNETVGTYTGDAIPDKTTAIEIAEAIFSGMNKSEKSQKYVPKMVFYDEEDEVWIVSFGQDSDRMIVGENCSIALQKSDGKILRIWFGE